MPRKQKVLLHITLISSHFNENVGLLNLVVSLFCSIIYNKSNDSQYGQAYKGEYDSILNDPTAKQNKPDQQKFMYFHEQFGHY